MQDIFVSNENLSSSEQIELQALETAFDEADIAKSPKVLGSLGYQPPITWYAGIAPKREQFPQKVEMWN